MHKKQLIAATALAAILGISMPAFFYSQFASLIGGDAFWLVILILVLGPIALIASTILSAHLTDISKFKLPLLWFLSAAEIGYALLLARALIQWYSTPENSHLEPLIVIISTGIAAMHWSRRQWTDLDKDEDVVDLLDDSLS